MRQIKKGKSLKRMTKDIERSDNEEKIMISRLQGYLFKRSRQKKWQKRWFQAKGHYLLYYRTNSSNKLLACIDLSKVIEIRYTEETNTGVEFIIQLSRDLYYHLKSPSHEETEKWINGLRARKDMTASTDPSEISVAEVTTTVDNRDELLDYRLKQGEQKNGYLQNEEDEINVNEEEEIMKPSVIEECRTNTEEKQLETNPTIEPQNIKIEEPTQKEEPKQKEEANSPILVTNKSDEVEEEEHVKEHSCCPKCAIM